MRLKFFLLSLIITLYPFCNVCMAQDPFSFTICTGGGTSPVSDSIFFDWSIGESTTIETFFGQNNSTNALITSVYFVTSGLLQPDYNTIASNSSISTWNTSELRTYPIPATNNVTIDFRSPQSGRVDIILTDRYGTTYNKQSIEVNNTTFQINREISGLLPGIYFFRITLTAPDGSIQKLKTVQFVKL